MGIKICNVMHTVQIQGIPCHSDVEPIARWTIMGMARDISM